MTSRKTVRTILWCVALVAGVGVIAQMRWEPQSPWLRNNSALFRAEAALGYLVGILYARRMANEYAAESGMRRAWRFMTAGVITFFAYQSLDVVLKLFPALSSPPTEDAWLIGISISLAFLLLGMLEMWFTFRAAGLTPALRKLDWLVVAVVTALTAARLAHGLEPHHVTANLLFRSIRGAGPLLVGAGTITAFLLYRSTVEFGHGQFSRAIRGLIAFFVIHLLLFQLDWYPSLWDVPAVDAITDAIYYVLPWLLALVLANCWNVPLMAEAVTERYRASHALPEFESI